MFENIHYEIVIGMNKGCQCWLRVFFLEMVETWEYGEGFKKVKWE